MLPPGFVLPPVFLPLYAGSSFPCQDSSLPVQAPPPQKMPYPPVSPAQVFFLIPGISPSPFQVPARILSYSHRFGRVHCVPLLPASCSLTDPAFLPACQIFSVSPFPKPVLLAGFLPASLLPLHKAGRQGFLSLPTVLLKEGPSPLPPALFPA